MLIIIKINTLDETRTHKSVMTMASKTIVYTNSTTRAYTHIRTRI